jgi:6-phosphogluconolactonase (cycloisomerase 2 family)
MRWEDVKSNRSHNTTYHNTTGRPIMVNMALEHDSNNEAQVSHNGTDWITITNGDGQSNISASFIVQDEHYYRATRRTPDHWVELRPTNYDISSASFDSMVLDVSTQETDSASMIFNDTGDILYVMGWRGDDINAYTLSTPYDISTASFDSVVLDVSGQASTPIDMLFNDTGDTLYVMGYNDDNINAYTLSTPYDISINAYTLSTPYDISTASFDSVALTDSSWSQTGPTDVIFDDTGNSLYVLVNDSNDIYEYALNTPYDISSYQQNSGGIVPTVALNVSDQEVRPRSLLFNDTGDTLYVLGSGDNHIYAYTID